MQRDIMQYDIVIIGAGPAGLASAIHLKQLAEQSGKELNVCIIDKGSEVGSHIISGCVMNPIGLTELIPNWKDLNFPVSTQVSTDELLFLTSTKSIKMPLPKDWQNYGNYVISLSQLCRRLAEYAEGLGVEIYPGFAAKEPLIEDGVLKGIITGDVGIDRNGQPTANYQAGIEIRAKQTIFAEGCRGSVTKQVMAYYNLNQNSQPQTYGLGIKEIWRIDSRKHIPGSVTHTIGYPLDNSTYGGGFIYHLQDNLVAIGLVTALDYKNPYLSPYEEFQRFKLHPQVKALVENGERLEYGARTVVEGGIQALPKLSFPGGVLVGDCAGFLNVPKIKGVHNAIKSGILAAKAVFSAINQNKAEAVIYKELFEQSWLYHDLFQVRNIRPAFQYGRIIGILYAAFEKFILRRNVPWTFQIKHSDRECLGHKSKFKAFDYKPYDNKITFDKASSVHLANVVHDDNQPLHLKLKDKSVPIQINLYDYNAPETRYCPAGVYEIIKQQGAPKLQINAQNCVHCKACDIKDPTDNIVWTIPEAGAGPQYSDM